MEVLLCDTKIVVRQQSGIATLAAPLDIMCHVIPLMMFWQLDSDAITMPVQGVEMGAGPCAVCWHRLDKRGKGSDGVEGQDGRDDQMEKTKNGGSKCQSHRMTIDPSTACSLKIAA